jgi:hypothetical protein
MPIVTQVLEALPLLGRQADGIEIWPGH